MKVLFCTEGGGSSGFGHISRSIALYQAFSERGVNAAIYVNCDNDATSLLRGTRFKRCDWTDKRSGFFSAIEGADIVIIDSYRAGRAFYKRVAGSAKLAVYMDDYKRLEYPPGVVSNGAILAEKMHYPKRCGITYMLGSDYQPLRKEFWNVPDKNVKRNIKTILVTFGGSHLPDFMEELCEFIKKKCSLSVIPIDPRIRKVNASGMRDSILEADLAVCAGGQTTYELARCGTPAIAVLFAENQSWNIIGWRKKGFLKYAGRFDDKGLFDNILRKIKGLDFKTRVSIANTGRRFSDGQGSRRFAAFCMRKYAVDNLALRKAREKDLYHVFELSNEDAVRKASFCPKKISISSHRKWFNERIRDPKTLFLVAFSGNNLLGQVRFAVEKESALISISVSNQFRGLGIGKILIEKAFVHLKSERPYVKKIEALIKSGNKTSKKFFEDIGFRQVENCFVKRQRAKKYIYDVKR